MRVVAVLTGAGGARLGFEQDGHDVAACEPPCFPSFDGELDVLLGSPALGEERLAEHDRFAALLADVRPRAFVLDTSPALARSKGELRAVYRALKGGGFRVSVKELDDQWLGAARSRRRLVLVGLRTDVAPDEFPPFPRPHDRRTTVADVCPWIVASRDRRVTFSTLDDGDGETFLDPAAPLPSNVRADVRFDVLVGGSRYPRRGLAMAELRRAAGYPDGFPLVGLRSEQMAALDSTASPPMARAVARELAAVLGGAG